MFYIFCDLPVVLSIFETSKVPLGQSVILDNKRRVVLNNKRKNIFKMKKNCIRCFDFVSLLIFTKVMHRMKMVVIISVVMWFTAMKPQERIFKVSWHYKNSKIYCFGLFCEKRKEDFN